MSDQLITEAST